MNHIYKTKWNKQTGTYVAVSEVTKSKGKRSGSSRAILAGVVFAAAGSFAMPALSACPPSGNWNSHHSNGNWQISESCGGYVYFDKNNNIQVGSNSNINGENNWGWWSFERDWNESDYLGENLVLVEGGSIRDVSFHSDGNSLTVKGGIVDDIYFYPESKGNDISIEGGQVTGLHVNDSHQSDRPNSIKIVGGEVSKSELMGDVLLSGGVLKNSWLGGNIQFAGTTVNEVVVNKVGSSSLKISGGEVENLFVYGSGGVNGPASIRLEMTGGTLSDGFFAGGSDHVTVTGGVIKNNLYMGHESDTVTLSGDLNQLAVLDGEGFLQVPPPPPAGVALYDVAGYRLRSEDSNSLSSGESSRLIKEITVGKPYEDGSYVTYSYYDEPITDSSTGYRKSDLLQLNTTLTGSSETLGAAGNTRISHWDVVNIGDKTLDGRLNLTGDLHSGWDDKRLGAMNIAATGTLGLAPNTPQASVRYDVLNAGTIDLREGSTSPNGQLTIEGNYTGERGSVLLVKTNWNNPDVQENDHLVIQGNAWGGTQVSVPSGIIGDVTIQEGQKNGRWLSPVVTVQGDDYGSTESNIKELTFKGTAETSNAGQAQLVKNGDSYYWVLEAVIPEEPEPEKPEPEKPIPPVTPPTAPILTPGTPGYVLVPRINREMGFAQMSRLHQRVGEQQTWLWDECGQIPCQYYDRVRDDNQPYPVWGRIEVGKLKEQGKKRFGHETDTQMIQFGVDLEVYTDNEKNHRHTGLMLTYTHADSDFYDKYRAENGVVVADKGTGSADSDMVSVGAYRTWYKANGTYLDLVGNVSWLHNKYKSQDGRHSSQNGFGLGASVEVGRPWQLGNSQWSIEPQAQLAYQYVNLNKADDGVRKIDGQSDSALRGRIGARLAWNQGNDNLRTNTVYVAANVLHDFIGHDSSVDLGRDRIKERFAKTWGEVSVGAQLPIGKSTYIYGDISYERNLGGYSNKAFRSSGTSREGYSGRVGLSHRW